MAEAGRQYQQIARELERKSAGNPSRDDILRRIARNLKQLGRDQERGRLSKKEALVRANELQKAMKEAERELGVPPGSRTLEEAGAELQKAADRQARAGNPEMARRLQQMSEALANGDIAAAQRALDAMGKELQQRGNDGRASPGEMRCAAEAMRRAANAVTGSRAEAAARKLREGAGDLEKAAAQADRLRNALARAQTPAERTAIESQLRNVAREGMCTAGT
jgi:hypothetical protein